MNSITFMIIPMLFMVVTLRTANALECYSCTDDQCLKADSWAKVPNCGKTATGNHIGACLKEVYINENKKEVTQRRCIIADKDASGKPSYTCKNGENKECKVCIEDLCNSAFKIPAMTSYLAIGIIALIALR